jgi:hypothetical protein
MITQPDLFELPPAAARPPCSRSFKQKTVIHFLHTHPDLSLTDAVPLIGHHIYYNQKKHIQRILSNMVKRGLLVRAKRGLYTLPHGKP